MSSAALLQSPRRLPPTLRALRQSEAMVLPRGTLACPPPVNLEMRLEWLRRPMRRETVWLKDSILAALADRDGRWAITCLELAGPRLSRMEMLHAVWLPFAIGCCHLDARRMPLRHRDEALAALRRSIRNDLRSSPPDEVTIWVMPTGPDAADLAAAHIAAACLAVRGLDARPWSWDGQPPSGRIIRCGAMPSDDSDGSTLSLLPVKGLHHISSLVDTGVPV
jgi:hypothetical protein